MPEFEFVDPSIAGALELAGLASFDALWQLDIGWFEEPNRRRGGWSGVSRFDLPMSDGSALGLFIKRQENHQTWSFRHPLRGVPTFEREFNRIMLYRECDIPSLSVAVFATRVVDGNSQAILITYELTGFQSMDAIVKNWLDHGAPPASERRKYLDAVADTLSLIHDQGIQHNCFFPKHVFVRKSVSGSLETRVIDLEKSRRRPLRTMCSFRDLYSLIRQSQCWSKTDQMYFFLRYLRQPRLGSYAKWLWRAIDRRAREKQRITRTQEKLQVAAAMR